ncbi:MAG: response regulator [Candidatus Marinimicrobia bacterium]|nr:response regulator [Candidatus Neomarinimicrobiota bacterium]
MKHRKRILIVDDEELNRELLEDLIESFGHEPETACDGIEALAKLKLDIDLILMDVMMPGMDGFEVTRRIKEDHETSDIPVVMVTALTSKEDRLRAVEVGANDFITKPIDKTELRIRTASLLKMKEAQDTVKRYQAELEKKVEQRTADLRQALAEMAESQRRTYKAHLDTIHRLSIAAEYKDEDTASHIHRMSNYCAIIARGLHLSPGEVELILHASPMHDIGKIGTPDAVLLKPGKLNDDEWLIMKQHTTVGSSILSDSESELLQVGENIAKSHQEKWDGSGYPNGLAGEEIPLYGRICAVADVFDALTSKRPYKNAFSNEKALEIMKEGRGKHFDPRILDIFLEHFDNVIAIQKKYDDQ